MPTSLPAPLANHPHLQNAAQLQNSGIFPGSPLPLFDAGRLSLMVLLHAGLYPDHRVLEIGCGALRSGYWLIHFLSTGGYHGIEPNAKMLEAGIKFIIHPPLFISKEPRFSRNADFEFSPFRTRFNFILACSIWSHAAKPQIKTMLNQFNTHTHPRARFLTSYIPATGPHDDYCGKTWVGRSHESHQKGSVRHSLAWIQAACHQRGLAVTSLPDVYNFSNQTWLMIERGTDS